MRLLPTVHSAPRWACRGAHALRCTHLISMPRPTLRMTSYFGRSRHSAARQAATPTLTRKRANALMATAKARHTNRHADGRVSIARSSADVALLPPTSGLLPPQFCFAGSRSRDTWRCCGHSCSAHWRWAARRSRRRRLPSRCARRRGLPLLLSRCVDAATAQGCEGYTAAGGTEATAGVSWEGVSWERCPRRRVSVSTCPQAHICVARSGCCAGSSCGRGRRGWRCSRGLSSDRVLPAAQMLRVCDISGKKANNANRVSFSNKHNAYLQQPNLQTKKFFSPALNRTVKLKIATSTLRTIRKNGLDETASKYGVDLSKF